MNLDSINLLNNVKLNRIAGLWKIRLQERRAVFIICMFSYFAGFVSLFMLL